MGVSDVLSDDEVDALLDKDNATAGNSAEAVDYDFTNKPSSHFGNLQRLETINDVFCAEMHRKFSQLLCNNITISAEPPTVVSFDEYINSIPQPMIMHLVQMKPLIGTSAIIYSADLVHRLIELFFGGSVSNPTNTEREIAKVELRIAQLALEEMNTCFSGAWQIIKDIEFNYIRSTTRLSLANIANPSDNFIINRYKMHFADTESEFMLCIPYSILDPIRHLIDSSTNDSTNEAENKLWKEALEQNMHNVSLKVTGNISETEITLSDLIKLKVGDIIAIDNPRYAEAFINDICVFKATCGARNGNHALRIIEWLKE